MGKTVMGNTNCPPLVIIWYQYCFGYCWLKSHAVPIRASRWVSITPTSRHTFAWVSIQWWHWWHTAMKLSTLHRFGPRRFL